MAIRLQPGLYKNTKGPWCCPNQVSGSLAKVETCYCDGVTLCAPMQCLCHAAVPCGTCCNEEDSQCYYAWVICYPASVMGLMVRDGGTKFEENFCCNCGEYELEKVSGSGMPQSVEMQRS